MAHVLVLGGGVGGLAGATRLREKLGPEHEITVVEPNPRFGIGLTKLWDLAGIRSYADSTRPLENLRRRGIQYQQARVGSIAPGLLSVTTDRGTLRADAILVALGAAYEPAHVKMLQGSAHNLYDAAALPAIQRQLTSISEGRIIIAVMGVPYKCPPAPYEAAMLLDERLRAEGKRNAIDIAAYTPQPSPLPVAGPEASARIAAALKVRSIELHAEHPIAGIEDNHARFANGKKDTFSLLLGVPKHVAPPVLEDSGLLGPSGWIEPERTTLRTSFDGVYAVGDCTHVPVPNGALPKAAVFAESEALVAADNIAADLGVGEPAELSGFGYCFLEFGGRTASYVRGDFFAEPRPDVEVSDPDVDTFRAKEAFVRDRLDSWL